MHRVRVSYENLLLVQRAFRIKLNCNPPNYNIRKWYHQFETQAICAKSKSPCSQALTPWVFYLWGFLKDHVYIPPLPVDSKTEYRGFKHFFAIIIPDTLIKV
ncbi:hypothetical protein C0J52_19467 [Blattella germanica]|nr:hypothetical protein C0J52_19467 [Blattella germanica]